MIFRSPYPDVEIPELPLTAVALRHAERLADKPALIDGPSGRALTYGQLAEERPARCGRSGGAWAAQGGGLRDLRSELSGVRRRLPRRRDAGRHRRAHQPRVHRRRIGDRLDNAGADLPDHQSGCAGPWERSSASSWPPRTLRLRRGPGATPFASLLPATTPRRDADRSPPGRGLIPYSSGTSGLPEGGDADALQSGRRGNDAVGRRRRGERGRRPTRLSCLLPRCRRRPVHDPSA